MSVTHDFNEKQSVDWWAEFTELAQQYADRTTIDPTYTLRGERLLRPIIRWDKTSLPDIRLESAHAWFPSIKDPESKTTKPKRLERWRIVRVSTGKPLWDSLRWTYAKTLAKQVDKVLAEQAVIEGARS